jgi:hypothetical protein
MIQSPGGCDVFSAPSAGSGQAQRFVGRANALSLNERLLDQLRITPTSAASKGLS